MTVKNRDWVEPAHPVIVEQFDDLVNIYRAIRETFQERIDAIFDSASRQIGFVVTTTLPVTVQIGAGGKITKMAFAAKNLEGTLFEREFAPTFKEMSGKSVGKVKAGDYSLQILWFEALKLKLKTEWMEPAHFHWMEPAHLPGRGIRPEIIEQLTMRVPPEVQEPAHWFDAGIALGKQEEVLISAIDEVYPELKLADRVTAARQATRFRVPGIREPAHFRQLLEEMVQTRSILGPGVREPAHFRQLAEILEKEETVQLLKELVAALKKVGM
ncbi:MAG TPA: hypothetical protein VKF36_20595 [Syntrophorhabdales bacterium]|nr:hypothetical protein [Syntrophorhabdales bacterium]